MDPVVVCCLSDVGELTRHEPGWVGHHWCGVVDAAAAVNVEAVGAAVLLQI